MILTVTPGINLSSVTGPISKAQLNQLGQPTVGLVPGSVVTADTNFVSLRCTDASFPNYELYNTAGPVDKKRARLAHDALGNIVIDRVNDAYTSAAGVVGWDASNNMTLYGPSLTVNGSIKNVTGAVTGASDASAWTIGAGSSVPGTGTGGGYVQLFGGTHSTWPGRVFFGTGTNTHGGFDDSGNLGVGTLTPAAKLHVAGDILIENTRAFRFLDTAGSSPGFACQVDNHFIFTGSSSTGGGRPIFGCVMQSDTSALQVFAPLKIGAAGVEFKSVLKATVTQTPNSGSPLAAGTLYQVTATVTGALPGALIIVKDSLANKPNLVLSAACLSADSVIVYYLNEGTSSFNWGTQAIDLYVFNT
jgi:hypothetical protein